MNEDPIPAASDKDLLMRVIAAIVALLIVVAVIGAVVLFTFFDVKQGNKELVIGLIGSLTLAFGTLMGYLYGRSSASDLHTRADVMTRSVQALLAPPPPPVPSPLAPPAAVELTTPGGDPLEVHITDEGAPAPAKPPTD